MARGHRSWYLMSRRHCSRLDQRTDQMMWVTRFPACPSGLTPSCPKCHPSKKPCRSTWRCSLGSAPCQSTAMSTQTCRSGLTPGCSKPSRLPLPHLLTPPIEQPSEIMTHLPRSLLLLLLLLLLSLPRQQKDRVHSPWLLLYPVQSMHLPRLLHLSAPLLSALLRPAS